MFTNTNVRMHVVGLAVYLNYGTAKYCEPPAPIETARVLKSELLTLMSPDESLWSKYLQAVGITILSRFGSTVRGALRNCDCTRTTAVLLNYLVRPLLCQACPTDNRQVKHPSTERRACENVRLFRISRGRYLTLACLGG